MTYIPGYQEGGDLSWLRRLQNRVNRRFDMPEYGSEEYEQGRMAEPLTGGEFLANFTPAGVLGGLSKLRGLGSLFGRGRSAAAPITDTSRLLTSGPGTALQRVPGTALQRAPATALQRAQAMASQGGRTASGWRRPAAGAAAAAAALLTRHTDPLDEAASGIGGRDIGELLEERGIPDPSLASTLSPIDVGDLSPGDVRALVEQEPEIHNYMRRDWGGHPAVPFREYEGPVAKDDWQIEMRGEREIKRMIRESEERQRQAAEQARRRQPVEMPDIDVQLPRPQISPADLVGDATGGEQEWRPPMLLPDDYQPGPSYPELPPSLQVDGSLQDAIANIGREEEPFSLAGSGFRPPAEDSRSQVYSATLRGGEDYQLIDSETEQTPDGLWNITQTYRLPDGSEVSHTGSSREQNIARSMARSRAMGDIARQHDPDHGLKHHQFPVGMSPELSPIDIGDLALQQERPSEADRRREVMEFRDQPNVHGGWSPRYLQPPQMSDGLSPIDIGDLIAPDASRLHRSPEERLAEALSGGISDPRFRNIRAADALTAPDVGPVGRREASPRDLLDAISLAGSGNAEWTPEWSRRVSPRDLLEGTSLAGSGNAEWTPEWSRKMNRASGGIVSLADGGYVPLYAYGGVPGYGIGGFLKGLGKFALKAAPMALSFIPGVSGLSGLAKAGIGAALTGASDLAEGKGFDPGRALRAKHVGWSR